VSGLAPKLCNILRSSASDDIGLDISRAYAIHPDPVGGVASSQGLSELQRTGLGYVVSKGACAIHLLTDEGGDRSEVNYRSALLFQHLWNDMLAAQEHALEIDVHQAVPFVHRHLGDVANEMDYGIVD